MTATDLAGYTVYQATTPDGPWTVATGTTPIAPTTWTAFGLINGVTYSFRVSAVDSTGNESHSSVIESATPFAAPPRLTSVSPQAVLAAGDDIVTLTGTGLSQVNAIVVDGKRITGLTRPNPATIQFKAPAAYPGNYLISLATSDGDVQTDHSLTFGVPYTEPVFKTTAADGTWVLAPEDLIAIERLADPARMVLVVAVSPDLTPGTAVYVTPGGTLLPTGLTARVESASPDDVPGQTRVTVRPAAADEVLDDFEINGSGPLTFEDEPPVVQLRYREGSGAILKANGSIVAQSAAGLVGGKSLFTCKDADGEPNQEIVTSLNINLRFENTRYILRAVPKRLFQDEFLNVGIWSEPVLSVTGTVKGQVTCQLSAWARDQAFPAVPVPGIPGAMIDIGPFFEVSVSAGGTFGYEQRFYRGFNYVKSGSARGVARASGSEDDPQIVGTMNASVRVSAGGFWELSLFDRVGVSAEFGPYLEGQIAYSHSPPTLTCALELGVSMSAKVFLDVLISRWEYEFGSLTLPIRTWETCSVADDGGDVVNSVRNASPLGARAGDRDEVAGAYVAGQELVLVDSIRAEP